MLLVSFKNLEKVLFFMRINVFIQRQQKKIDIELDGKTPKDLLAKLNINPTAVIIARDKEIITEDTQLKNNDSIELLSVISGG